MLYQIVTIYVWLKYHYIFSSILLFPFYFCLLFFCFFFFALFVAELLIIRSTGRCWLSLIKYKISLINHQKKWIIGYEMYKIYLINHQKKRLHIYSHKCISPNLLALFVCCFLDCNGVFLELMQITAIKFICVVLY